MNYNGVNITLNNSKLGGFIPSLDLPPIVTCRKNAPCAKGCYARRGSFLYPSKKESMAQNLALYKNDPCAFFDAVKSFLNNRDISFKFFRWFGAGDLVDNRFFIGCVNLATECKETHFLMFTKKYEIVNNFLDKGGVIPNNLRIVFSYWDKTFKVQNPHNLPCAYVQFKDVTKQVAIPEYAIPCTGSCATCKACWTLQNNQNVYFAQH